MQRQIKRHMVAPGLTALALLVWIPGSHGKADNSDRPSIIGTWILSATLAPGFIDTELSSINPGGTWTTTSSVFNAHSSQNPFLLPFLTIDASDGYGAWARAGGSNQFALHSLISTNARDRRSSPCVS